jgi:AraC family transcriptional regulator
LRYEGRLPISNGVHFGGKLELRFVSSRQESTMKLELRELTPRKAVCIAHSGPYFMIGQTFGQLGQWLAENHSTYGNGIAFYYDDPESTPTDQLRSDAGAIVEAGFQTDDPRVHLVEVAGGAFMVGTHVGPYDSLPNAWGEMMGSSLPEGYTYRNSPPFEFYVNNCADTPAADLITELHLAVKKAE